MLPSYRGLDLCDPASTYDEVLSRLRGGGTRARSQRLAVVVSKVDVLRQWGVEIPTEDSRLSEWTFFRIARH